MSDVDDPLDGSPQEEEDGLVLDDDESNELKEVFATIFPQYLQPIEELVGQLLDGQSSPEIVEGLRGALGPLVGAAKSIGISQIESVLQEFQGVVDQVHSAGGSLDEQTRGDVIDVFYRLKETVLGLANGEPLASEPPHSAPATAPMPEKSAGSPATAATEDASAAGEQDAPGGDFVKRVSAVEGVDAEHVQRLLAAGVTTADGVAGATVDEIAAVTGFDSALSGRIHAAFEAERRALAERREAYREANRKRRCEASASGGKAEVPVSATDTADLLSGRVQLVQLVRERVRLAEMLRLEQGAMCRWQHDGDELECAIAVLRNRLQNGREDLAHERELLRRSEVELERVTHEIERVAATATEIATEGAPSVRELRRTVDRLRRRIAGHDCPE